MERYRRSDRINRKSYKKWLILIILILFLTGTVVILAKMCKTKEYTVEGNYRYTDEQIIAELVTGKLDEYAPLLFLKDKMNRIDEIPFIEYVEIELEASDSVKIYVYEKIVCGCVEIMGKYMYFDKDGTVTESTAIRNDDTPLVTGLRFDNILIGEKIIIDDDVLFNKILNLSLVLKKHDCKIDEIHFNSDYSVILYSGDSRALMGIRVSYEEEVKVLADLISAANGSAYEYDFRYFNNENKKVIAKPISQ